MHEGQGSNPTGTQRARMNLRALVRRLGPAGVLSAFAAAMPAVGAGVIALTIGRLVPWLQSLGAGGILLYVASFWVLGGLALLPTWAQSVVGGAVFGFWAGLAGAVASFIGACVVSYGIAWRTAGKGVMQLLSERPKWQAVHDALLACGAWRAFTITVLMRLSASPFAFTNVLFASVRAPRGAFILGTLLGIMPRTAFMVYVGTRIRPFIGQKNFDFREIVRREAANLPSLVISITAAAVAVGLVALLAKRAIDRVAKEKQS